MEIKPRLLANLPSPEILSAAPSLSSTSTSANSAMVLDVHRAALDRTQNSCWRKKLYDDGMTVRPSDSTTDRTSNRNQRSIPDLKAGWAGAENLSSPSPAAIHKQPSFDWT